MQNRISEFYRESFGDCLLQDGELGRCERLHSPVSKVVLQVRGHSVHEALVTNHKNGYKNKISRLKVVELDMGFREITVGVVVSVGAMHYLHLSDGQTEDPAIFFNESRRHFTHERNPTDALTITKHHPVQRKKATEREREEMGEPTWSC